MSVSKNMKQQELGDSTMKVRESKAAASPKSGAKKDGTRWGTLADWRGAEKGKGESPASRRNRLRDGK
jgi:hypothetical protein